jgi:hypothetical protein
MKAKVGEMAFIIGRLRGTELAGMGDKIYHSTLFVTAML